MSMTSLQTLGMSCAGIAGTLVYGVVVINSQFVPEIRMVWREVRDQPAAVHLCVDTLPWLMRWCLNDSDVMD